MESLLSALPTGSALVVYLLCLLVGTYVIYRFCLDQFDKPGANNDDHDPWKFVVPRYQAPPRQYLIGFSVYCGTLMLIFVAISLIGPGPFFEITKALVGAAAQADIPVAHTTPDVTLQNYPTFPILVAFYIVGLNPNLPKALDFEYSTRRFALAIAYIPKNMKRTFNFMRFSEFDLSDDKISEAWNAIDLRRPALNAAELKNIVPVFNRTVVLYARAATLAGDLDFQDAKDLQPILNLDVFGQYREEIQNVGVNLQAIHARLSEPGASGPTEIRKAQGDLIKILEKLYVIFACAITAKGNDRMSDRLRTVGFTSAYPPREEIPWNPILNVAGAAALVLTVACAVAINTFLGTKDDQLLPTNFFYVVQQIVIILIVHFVAVVQALNLRNKLIGREEYFSETGKGNALAYLKIFAKCFAVSVPLYLVLYFLNLLPALADTGNVAQQVLAYVSGWLKWSVVPGCCGVMTAVGLDRPSNRAVERGITGVVQGAAMAFAALLVVVWTLGDSASLAVRTYYVIIYGGLGLVLGCMLPTAIRRYWSARDTRLPDRISMLRTAVRQYFYDIQQFSEWLNATSDRLEGKRPLDILAEENGLQRLTAFVASTRMKVPRAIG
jgi:hypothetical protein